MSTRFSIHPTPLPDLMLIQRHLISDERGYLERMFCAEELKTAGLFKPIVQINHTLTYRRGTLRGLHYQNPPYAEMKIVTCLCGEVFDVAVDLRSDSPTFLHWHAERLSADNHKSLLIPEGFAHGFQAMTTDCEMLYFHTAAYMSEVETGVYSQDVRLAIDWPLPIAELSARDAALPHLKDDFSGVRL